MFRAQFIFVSVLCASFLLTEEGSFVPQAYAAQSSKSVEKRKEEALTKARARLKAKSTRPAKSSATKPKPAPRKSKASVEDVSVGNSRKELPCSATALGPNGIDIPTKSPGAKAIASSVSRRSVKRKRKSHFAQQPVSQRIGRKEKRDDGSLGRPKKRSGHRRIEGQ